MASSVKRVKTSEIEKLPFQQNPTMTRKEVLKWEFENMAIWDGKLKYSDPFVFDNITWKIGVERAVKEKLTIFLVLCSCDLEGRGWLLKTGFDPKLHLKNGKVKNSFVIENELHYDFGGYETTPKRESLSGCFELSNKMDSSELCMLEIALEFAYYDFNREISSIPHIILKVDNVPLYFNKYLLTSISEYFYNAIKEEKDGTQELKIDDITLQEMLFFLGSICPVSTDVSYYNYEIFLKLANKFNVPLLFNKMEKWFKNESGMAITDKIYYADKYGLQGYLKTIGDEFRSAREIQTIISENFSDLKKETQDCIIRCLSDFQYFDSDDEDVE